MSIAQIRAERRRYFDEAKARVKDLKELALRRPPLWNPPTGRADVDALVWFDSVHTDDPWSKVPDQAAERPLPSRCGLFTDLTVALN